ncbi:MAG TPA: hypothetical protein VHW23_25290 [Kofleriaceae bacterium]|jgi:hypothetical protein|nr:hypothetical protein [Kofleriaceae bacterium]
MTDLPVTRFFLDLQLDTRPARAVLSDPSDAASSADVELGAAPYQLGMTFTAGGSDGRLVPQLGTLTVVPTAPPPPFDPALDGDDGVLSIDWDIVHKRRLETQDTARLQIRLTNRSNYYEADHLRLVVRALSPDGTELTATRDDGSALLSLWPAEQEFGCLRAHQTARFDYLVVTRGPRPDLYTLAVDVHYQLVYVYRELCREIGAIAHLPLRIHGANAPAHPGPLVPAPPASPLERISISHRRLHMSDNDKSEFGHPRHRELHAIERKVILPGGGELVVRYRLVKGSHTRPDDSRGSFGINPQTREIESYFSTSDEAAMEIILLNKSELHLKHVRITNVRLFAMNDDDSVGAAADAEKLPDGNLLFEVLPNDVYFGQLLQDDARVKYLGLVTRGVHSGRFFVRFDLQYEIVDGCAIVHLPLTVNPD